MSSIVRTIQVNFRQQVHFTHDVFAPENVLLRDALVEEQSSSLARVLVVVDEALCSAQPDLITRIEDYFTSHGAGLNLVCSPLIIEGGERTKNSYFLVSEIHSHIDRFHIDRHSYVLA